MTMSVIIIRSSFSSANLAIIEALFVVTIFAVWIYNSWAFLSVFFGGYCFKMFRVTARSLFALMMNKQSLRDWSFEKFIGESMNSYRYARGTIHVPVPSATAIRIRLDAACPNPASRGMDENLCSHSLWKSVNVKPHIFASTVAHAAVEVFV